MQNFQLKKNQVFSKTKNKKYNTIDLNIRFSTVRHEGFKHGSHFISEHFFNMQHVKGNPGFMFVDAIFLRRDKKQFSWQNASNYIKK